MCNAPCTCTPKRAQGWGAVENTEFKSYYIFWKYISLPFVITEISKYFCGRTSMGKVHDFMPFKTTHRSICLCLLWQAHKLCVTLFMLKMYSIWKTEWNCKYTHMWKFLKDAPWMWGEYWKHQQQWFKNPRRRKH